MNDLHINFWLKSLIPIVLGGILCHFIQKADQNMIRLTGSIVAMVCFLLIFLGVFSASQDSRDFLQALSIEVLPGIDLQLAVFAQPFILILITTILTWGTDGRESLLKKRRLVAAIFTTIWLLMIAWSSDPGAFAIYLILFATLFYTHGFSYKSLIPLNILYILLPVIAQKLFKQQFFSLIENNTIYLEAIQRGGLTGIQGVPRLPELSLFSNDYAIFASVAEQGGLVSLLPLLAALAWLCTHLMKTILAAKTPTDMMLISGAGVLIIIQAILHIFTCIAIIPQIGIYLPCINYSASSILGTWILLGIFLRDPEQLPERLKLEADQDFSKNKEEDYEDLP
ncbi:MAG: FtsW/RodA/SpoVE family cell cycle protein [Lentisphaeria bacterium]|nr:FtsW/RodA/SpoVE family cell cycle protein [Lentisphaeria bacterium]